MANKPKHTPAPWRLEPAGDGYFVVGAHGQIIAHTMQASEDCTSVTEAHDAVLLKAAPALLALARDLVAYEAVKFDGPQDEDLNVSAADTVDWLCAFRDRAKAVIKEATP